MTITRNFSILAESASSTGYLNPYVGKNRIINGNMAIDQRNAGATVVPAVSAYTLDRWYFQITQASKVTIGQNYGGVTPPAGFSKYLGAKITTAYAFAASDYTVINQPIEGYNFADLNWGTANAKAVTLSFWVYSSVTGTFGGSVQAAAGARSYPFTYTISVASTWELKSVTIAGDTSGSYNTTTGVGLYVTLSLGAGSTFMGTAGSWSGSNYLSATGANNITNTLNATFYFTGVQLEVGSIATPYEFNQYQAQLAQCERYYYAPLTTGVNTWAFGYIEGTVTSSVGGGSFPVTMRATPTLTLGSTSTFYSPTGGGSSAVLNSNRCSTTTLGFSLTISGSYVLGYGCAVYDTAFGAGQSVTFSAEL